MRRVPKYTWFLSALLIFACVCGPMHVIADDAAHMHERIAHRADSRVISDGDNASHSHHHHHHDHAAHHHDDQRADSAHDDSLAHNHKPHHNNDHRHFLSEHEIVSTRTILAKNMDVASLSGIALPIIRNPKARIVPDTDRAIALFASLPPPRRGPPSFQDFTIAA